MYRRFFKRFCDIVLSLMILVVLAIPLALIALAIKLDSKGPVVFRQTRLGLGGREFSIYKFRTMCVGAEQMGTGVYSGKGDTRVTRVGKFLRASSADELLQAINILKGDMSFVGPRPPLTYHPWPIDEYTDEQKRMFDVRPGITGWAQVNGRKLVEWNRRIELNVWYVDNLSLWLDIKILFMTVFKVFANADNESKGATVQKKAADTASAISDGEAAATCECAEGSAASSVDGEAALAETLTDGETALEASSEGESADERAPALDGDADAALSGESADGALAVAADAE